MKSKMRRVDSDACAHHFVEVCALFDFVHTA